MAVRVPVLAALLAAACLETPGLAPDGGPPSDDAGVEPGATAWQIPLGQSLPYVAAAPDGFVVAAGFLGTIDLDPPVTASGGRGDLLLAGFGQDGDERFATVYGAAADEIPTAVTVSPVSGDIAVAGLYGGGDGNVGGEALPAPSGPFDAFAARYNASGEHMWSHAGTSTSGVGAGYSISMSGSGAVILTGDTGSQVTMNGATTTYSGVGRDIYFLRLSSEGTVGAAVGFGGDGDQLGMGALYDDLGTIYLFGNQTGSFVIDGQTAATDGDGDLFLCRIDDTGTSATWMLDSVGGGVGGLRGAVTSDGWLVLTGWFEDTFAFDVPDATVLTSRGGSDVFVALIRPDGTVGLLEQFGGVGDDQPRGVALGPDDVFAITGSFRGSARLGVTSTVLDSNGGTDIFVVAFDSAHQLIWARRFGDVEDDTGLSVAVGEGGAVLLGAIFRGVVDFGGGQPIDSGGVQAGALVRFR